MARRADHSRKELEVLILDKAWEIIGREGFEGLTARRIAAEIGYAPGTIYNVFKSMDDLLLRINARALDELYAALGDPAPSGSKSLERNLKAMAAQYALFAREKKPYWLMLFSHRPGNEGAEQEWYREKINLLFGPLEDALRPHFSPQGEKQLKIAARSLWAAVHGLCILRETGKTVLLGAEEKNMFDFLIKTFVAGLKKNRK